MITTMYDLSFYKGAFMKMPEYRILTLLFRLLPFFCTTTIFSNDMFTVLVVAPHGMIYEQVAEGLGGELGISHSIQTMFFDSNFTAADFNVRLAQNEPTAVVLMGNRTIRVYKQYVDECRKSKNPVPVITLLAAQMEQAIDGLDNVQGIGYETPIVTALVNFRKIINKPIIRVGIVYRSVFEPFVKQQTDYCKKEKIDIVGIMIGTTTKNLTSEIRNALQQLIHKNKVDAVWVPNDNVLLTPEFLGEVWIPVFRKNKIPVIVGVESLVKPELDFGTFAVIPDPKAMGEQAAELVYDLEESGLKFTTTSVYPAISVYSVLNMKKLIAVPGIVPSRLKLDGVSKVLTSK
jgi:hypothetical protein